MPSVSKAIFDQATLAYSVQCSHKPVAEQLRFDLGQALITGSVFVSGIPDPSPKVLGINIVSWFGRTIRLDHVHFPIMFLLAAASWCNANLPPDVGGISSPFVPAHRFPGIAADEVPMAIDQLASKISNTRRTLFRFAHHVPHLGYKLTLHPSLILIDWHVCAFYPVTAVADLAGEVYRRLTGRDPSIESCAFYN